MKLKANNFQSIFLSSILVSLKVEREQRLNKIKKKQKTKGTVNCEESMKQTQVIAAHYNQSIWSWLVTCN